MSILSSLTKDKTTRRKFLMTMIIMFAVQIGYRIPLPGIDTTYLKLVLSSVLNNGNFLNAMTGGSFSNMSIFALSITPYITASIIIQLLTVAIPRLEAIQRDGAVGQKKIERLTMIVGGIVAVVESLGIALGFGRQGLLVKYTWYMILYATVVWTAGACFLMWLGQWITDHLVGNGISLMLLFNMLSTLPQDAMVIYNAFAAGTSVWIHIVFAVVVLLVVFAVFAYVVVLDNSEKRIKITSSHNAGGVMMNTGDNFLPIKLNTGGVMPIIFSSSIINVPVLIASFMSLDPESTGAKIINCFNQSYWFEPSKMIYTLGIIPYILLTFVFAYFYLIISFSPKEIADNLRKSGTTVPGLRPGQPTAEYLDKQSKSLLVLGTTMLMFIAILPTAFSGLAQIGRLSFGGTTVLIIVSVILETASKLEAKTANVNYKTFLKKMRKGGKR